MAKLIYVSNVSLDGYIEDEHGSFDWTAPDDVLFAFITDLVRPWAPTSTAGGCTTPWPPGDRPGTGRPVGTHGRLRRHPGGPRMVGDGRPRTGRLTHQDVLELKSEEQDNSFIHLPS
jgi:hypothetical protein